MAEQYESSDISASLNISARLSINPLLALGYVAVGAVHGYRDSQGLSTEGSINDLLIWGPAFVQLGIDAGNGMKGKSTDSYDIESTTIEHKTQESYTDSTMRYTRINGSVSKATSGAAIGFVKGGVLTFLGYWAGRTAGAIF